MYLTDESIELAHYLTGLSTEQRRRLFDSEDNKDLTDELLCAVYQELTPPPGRVVTITKDPDEINTYDILIEASYNWGMKGRWLYEAQECDDGTVQVRECDIIITVSKKKNTDHRGWTSVR